MKHMILAIDDLLMPLRKSMAIYLTKPTVHPEPVLIPSAQESLAADNKAAHFYGTVMEDGGRFRMWYYACHWGKNPDWSKPMMRQIGQKPHWNPGDVPLYQGPLCYAESDDGIHWTKPNLNQVVFKGSTANNAMAMPHTVVCSPLIIKDEADPNPAHRYKMIYQFFPDQSVPLFDEYGWMPTIATATSEDGLHWTVNAIPYKNQFIEPSSFFRHGGQYVVHYQTIDFFGGYLSEGGASIGRTGVARMTYDWDHWPDLVQEAFALAEPENPAERGMDGAYDQVHLGVGATSFGNVCIGLYGLWHNTDNKASFDKISCDFGLLISNDGVRFREPVKGHRFLRREDSPATSLGDRQINTVLCQANGIINVGDETRIYHGRWRNVGSYDNDSDVLKDYYGEIGLATIPRDRWGALALNPKEAAGTCCTAPIPLSGAPDGIHANADGVDGMTFELLDAHFQPIGGFSEGRVEKDGLNGAVTWKNQSLSKLAGKSVRVRVHVKRVSESSPRLYALYIDSV